jgi:hypothetical protein
MQRVKVNQPVIRTLLSLIAIGLLVPAPLDAQIKAQVRSAPTPPWNKGITAINAESYYNAIECGKQGGDSPACLFWDTDLCKNDDFVLAWYTPYKQVAYEVWSALRQKKAAPAAELCRGATSTRDHRHYPRKRFQERVERLRD